MIAPAQVDLVLVRPRNPLNIGAAARAMANFGFENLTVVDPFEPHWREARSAVDSTDILQNAEIAGSLAEAIADCTLVAGTGTLTHRKPEQPVVPLPALAPLVQRELARGGRIALVFGPEKHGLTREDLSFCHILVEIPTSPSQPSMNLGQAVAVCLYELSSHAFPALQSHPTQEENTSEPRATAADLDLLAGLIEETMESAGYSPSIMKAANQHDLRLLLRRLAPDSRDTRRILGIFRRILWRLRRVPKAE